MERKKSQGIWLTIASCVFIGAFWSYSSRLHGLAEDESLLAKWESAYGWIDVIRFESGALQLRQNVHYGMGSTGSLEMEQIQTDLPLLLHPSPAAVLHLGLATGITAGTALDHPDLRSLTVVELIADVQRGAAYFADFNRNVLEDRRAEIVINDARHYLLAVDRKFDAIVADLFVPWESHTGYLYTVEHYQAARRRLAEGGLFCQWLPLWQVSAAEFRTIADSFAAVFPVVTVWFGKADDHWTILGLVGTEKPLQVDLDQLSRRISALAKPAQGSARGIDKPGDLLVRYAGDWTPKGRRRNTDDFPIIEFEAPVSAWSDGGRLKYKSLESFLQSDIFELPTNSVEFPALLGQRSYDRGQARLWQRSQVLNSKP